MLQSAEILQTAAQLHEKSHLKRPVIGDDLIDHSRSSEMSLFSIQ